MGPTGEWTVFRLEHPDGHWYRGRWDERGSALDIDLFPTKRKRTFPAIIQYSRTSMSEPSMPRF
jgi:hypothetical protein